MTVTSRLACGLLLAACTGREPAPSTPDPGPAGASAPTPAPAAETCILGAYEVQVQQRMVQDDGVTAHLEDQRIGEVPLLFAAQQKAIEARAGQPPFGARSPVPNAPHSPLLLARGAMVTREFDDLGYVPHPDGAKPTQTTTSKKSYTFFLADAAWDCAALEAELAALPRGQAGPAACVPEGLRARCNPVDSVRAGG